MSLKALCDFVVHFESFRNIDLYHQGLYHLRVTIYHEKNGQKIFAQPYNVQEGYKYTEGRKKTYIPNIIPAHVLDGLSAFCTRTFLIRFCDEEVELNDLCHFRTEYDAYPEYKNQDFYLETELMYSDPINNIRSPNQAGGNVETNFKCVATFKSKISNAYMGIHEYVPVLFDEHYYCISFAMVHSILVDFRFRLGTSEKPKIQNKYEESKSEGAGGGGFRPTAKSFKEFLSNSTAKFRAEEIDGFYSYYIKALKRGYDELQNHYNFILHNCINQQNEMEVLRIIKSAPDGLKYIPDESPKDTSLSKEDSVKEKRFSEIFSVTDPDLVSNAILQEVNSFSTLTNQLWNLYLEIAMAIPKNICNVLQEEYHKKVGEKWSHGFYQKAYKISDLASTYESRVGENHATMAESKRKTLYPPPLKSENKEKLVDLKMFPPAEFHPIIFEEVCIRDSHENEADMEQVLKALEGNYNKSNYKGIHLIVLCHGFQGNSFDMRLVKNNISMLHKQTLFLCATSNEDMTDGEIEDMGVRLSEEVRSYIKEWCPGANLGRLSFIGHSLGGLIIRAALPYLEEFKDKMHLFMTFSSPHLGYLYNPSTIVNAGMWLLKKWKKSTCLGQLSLTDNKNYEETLIYRLSEYKGLEWFKNIALVSSYQDKYAPFESARIQFNKESLEDLTRGPIYVKMARNILSRIQAHCLYRIDVNYNLPSRFNDWKSGAYSILRKPGRAKNACI